MLEAQYRVLLLGGESCRFAGLGAATLLKGAQALLRVGKLLLQHLLLLLEFRLRLFLQLLHHREWPFTGRASTQRDKVARSRQIFDRVENEGGVVGKGHAYLTA